MHKIRTMLKTVLAVVTASVMGTGILAGLVPMTSFAKEGAKINIVYNSGPAGAGTATQAYTEGTVKQLKSPEDLGWNYAGHSFRGWKDEDGTFYSPGESISDWSTGTAYVPASGSGSSATPEVPQVLPYPYVTGNTTPGADTASVTLTAQWDTDSYTVNFNANGGSGSMQSQEYSCAASYTLPKCSFTPSEGHVFAGWATEPAGNVVYNDGAQVRDLAAGGASVTLYARWNSISYQVAFNPNGGTGGMTNITVAYEENFIVPSCGYTKEDASFLYWKDYTSGTTYSPGATLSKLASKSGAVVTFYAVWADDVVVTWQFEGGTLDKAKYAQTTYSAGEKIDWMPNPTRSGYDLDGWYTATGTQVTTDTVVTKSFTAYASWDRNYYYIKFSGNGSDSGKMDKQLMYYGLEDDLDANEFKKNGYTFKEWNTKANGSGDSYSNEDSVHNLTSVDGATVTLYAQWKPDSYTVIFNGNGSTAGYMENQVANAGVSFNLNRNTYQRLGYVFNGWNTRSDGSGQSYTDGQSVTDLVSTVNNSSTNTTSKSITLFAQWVTPNGQAAIVPAGTATTTTGGKSTGTGAGIIQTGSINPLMYVFGAIFCLGIAVITGLIMFKPEIIDAFLKKTNMLLKKVKIRA